MTEEKPKSGKKKIVVPGDLVTEQRKRLGKHVFTENGKIYSDALGITNPDSDSASVVPLHGNYVPGRNDIIIGIVSTETYNGYLIEINSIYKSFISKDMVRDRLQKGSVISAVITNVNEVNEADLDDIRSFFGGEVIEVSPSKVPRVIGKSGSMMQVLKNGTGANIVAGRNGWVWAKDGNIPLLLEAIDLIEKEAHLSNLTNKVEEFLKKKSKEKVKSE